MVKALRQDPMHSPHIYRHGFQAALPFGACRSTTVAPDSVPRFSSHLLSFSGSARNAELPLFYHNQIESVSRFLFSCRACNTKQVTAPEAPSGGGLSGHLGARGLLRLAHSGRRKGGEGGGGSTLALGCTSLHFCSLFCPGSRPSSLCRPGALPAGSVALPWQRPRGKHALPLRPDEGPTRVALRAPLPAPSAPPSSPRFL